VKALVVGGTASTGPHIVAELLRRGYEVAGYHRLLSNAKIKGQLGYRDATRLPPPLPPPEEAGQPAVKGGGP
jgi:nucleoside-diphosphate-sugar epimerase